MLSHSARRKRFVHKTGCTYYCCISKLQDGRQMQTGRRQKKKPTRKWVFEYPLAMSVGNGFRRWEGIKVRKRVTSSTTPLSPQALLKLSLSLHREKSIRTQPAMVTCREKSLCSQLSMVTQDYTLWNWQADPRGWQVPGKFELPREALSGIFVLRWDWGRQFSL